MHEFFIFGQLLFQEPKKNTTSAKFMRLNVFLRMRQGLEQRRSRPTQARSTATSAEAGAKAELRKARFLRLDAKSRPERLNNEWVHEKKFQWQGLILSIDFLVDKILESYSLYGGVNRMETENFPNRENIVAVLNDLQWLIFPGFKTADILNEENLRFETGLRVNRVIALLTSEIKKAMVYITNQSACSKNIHNSHCFELAEKTAVALTGALPELRKAINLDAQALLNGDPAAKTIEEIILSYPGLEAILVHRLAHFLFEKGVPIIPRMMSEYIHGKTGIDIHPGAKIGSSFFIDHGTGIVIGETTKIGNNVKLYQGVTLGALSVQKELMNKKRHPTIEDDVTIYSGATILGGETVIGKGCIIGGNTWITKSVPAGTTVIQKK